MFLTLLTSIHELSRKTFLWRAAKRHMVWKVFDAKVFLFSGHQAQNPLLLLEQYSDDEVDEDLNKNSDHDGQDGLLPDHNDEVFYSLLLLELQNMITT